MGSDNQPQYSQEIRYAVVMYGGISLAIYMNGIAQEMLRLVRSTSVEDPELLSGTERIYREIACLLHLGRKPGATGRADTPRTRFVIDLLSGTSAGGINAVFLAKALARKSKDLEDLRRLWMTKADIDTLLNDGKSSEGGRFPISAAKKSLLNSGRMYGLLREAFEQMDNPAKAENDAREAADRIDLYVTATDLNGLVVPIELTDKALLERAHRSVFHFEYDIDEALDDFTAKDSAMLAFAARCTSSFPVAFEPMKFSNIRPELTAAEIERFGHFFETYVPPGGEGNSPLKELNFQERVFADGGYLDNRPFGYLIDRIGERTSNCAAFRKLVFVDPFPEHLDRRPVYTDFDFVQNAVLAASTLPRYETIRQDLVRIIDTNRLALRAAEIEKTVFKLDPTGAALVPSKMRIDNYRKLYMDDLLEKVGPLFVTDQLMKVSSVSNWLALVATRQLGLNESGDYYRVIRLIVSAWRRENFLAARPQEGQASKRSETEFISNYDMAFRLCRLRHVIYMIDRVSAYTESEFEDFRQQLVKVGLLSATPQSGFSSEAFLAVLSPIRKRDAELLAELQRKKKRIEARSRRAQSTGADFTPLTEQIDSLKSQFTEKELLQLLFLVGPEQQLDYAKELYQRSAEKIDRYFETLAEVIRCDLRGVHDEREILTTEEASLDPMVSLAARWVTKLWDSYEVVGNVMARLLPHGQIGESGRVDIFRIGPADTDLTIRDTKEKEQKLAGAKLGAFGAFLSEGWRENDILWGRLDGAERLIVSLLPDEADKLLREQYVQRVRDQILAEEFDPANGRIYRWLAGQVQSYCGPGLSEKELVACLDAVSAGPLQDVLKTLQVTPARWQPFLTAYYAIPSGPGRGQQADWLFRTVRIAGEMMEGLGSARGVGRKVTFAGMALCELLQVSLPGSLRNLWFSHILVLLMLAGAALVVLGALFTSDFATVGVKLLLYAGTLWSVLLLIRLWLSRDPLWKRILAFTGVFLVISVLTLTVLGFGVMTEYLQEAKRQLMVWFR